MLEALTKTGICNGRPSATTCTCSKGLCSARCSPSTERFTPRFSCEDDVTMEEVDGDGIVEEILEEGDEEVENESEISDDDASLDVGEY